jgi:CheY-like chemotaxis protein
MPGMDGYQVCERLREKIEAPIAVIFLTGTTHAGTSSCLEQLVNQSGGDYFLVKPYDPELLVELVSKITKEATSEQSF